MSIMAKKKSTEKVFTSLVSKNIGTNKDGSPKVVLVEGKPITGLTFKQVQNFKILNYIK